MSVCRVIKIFFFCNLRTSLNMLDYFLPLQSNNHPFYLNSSLILRKSWHHFLFSPLVNSSLRWKFLFLLRGCIWVLKSFSKLFTGLPPDKNNLETLAHASSVIKRQHNVTQPKNEADPTFWLCVLSYKVAVVLESFYYQDDSLCLLEKVRSQVSHRSFFIFRKCTEVQKA